MNLQAARDYILQRLQSELNPQLHYHSLLHTFDVHEACCRLIKMEKVHSTDQVLIETAAFYHDAGIIESVVEHEETSVKIANEVLPGFGYEPAQIEAINKMILCTKLPQFACGLNARILCDADLDYLGRRDYFMISHRLRCEWEFLGKPVSLIEWYQLQLEFLQHHQYFTESAKQLRLQGKQENLMQIRNLLGAG